jgi:hypothetical protein
MERSKVWWKFSDIAPMTITAKIPSAIPQIVSALLTFLFIIFRMMRSNMMILR